VSDIDRPASFLATIRADLDSACRHKRGEPLSLVGLIDVLFFPGVMAVLLFRLSSVFHRIKLRPISRLLYILNLILFSVDLAPGASVGGGLVLPHPVGVAFAPGVKIGRDVRLYQGVQLGGGAFAYEHAGRDGFPTLDDACWIFADAKVLGPVTVGARAIVATDSLVVRSVPPDAVAAGSPARVVRYRAPEATAPSEARAAAKASVGRELLDGAN
jgi:serine O-acetyltransferase